MWGTRLPTASSILFVDRVGRARQVVLFERAAVEEENEEECEPFNDFVTHVGILTGHPR
jgi:hypothetical protein